MVSSSDIKLNKVNNANLGESLPLTTEENLGVATTPKVDPLKTATGVYVTVHGHFYQPPRENPYLGTIERQPSAAPFHNWNERIHQECYRPNAFARVLNDGGELVGIVNNYEYLSFNIGATLMNWLELYDTEVYQKIIEADRKSCQRLNGRGNAIAQVYNHIIMPLANERDKYTQIRWGKEDFRSHFGRDPEGMWLAETAVDYATLEALVAEGIKFIILAPSQAERCRTLAAEENPDPQWVSVGNGEIDATRPYRCYLKGGGDGDRSEPAYIDIFFYDGPISNDMGFSDVLNSSNNLVERLSQAVRNDDRPTQVISVATDGETFGHHKGGTEKCLAYAFSTEFPQRHWTVTNLAHYLSICPPAWEVELKPVTAWSCSHGVERWQSDCGCGGGGAWHQKWRRPLRESLNWLRDRLIEVYEDAGSRYFVDVWAARDEYIGVMRDRSAANVNHFLARHQRDELSELEKVDALRLLEMQRHSLLMFTSCGWFFEEISRPEGTQILRYASRAIELAGDVAGVDLEKQFLKLLALAPSNVECFKTGDEIYRQLVMTAQVSLEQVAAHYAINSLFTTYTRDQQVYCYSAKQLDYQMRRMGSLTLAVGHLQLISEFTRECKEFVFAVLHLGSWDFHCCIEPFKGRRFYSDLKEQLFASLERASVASVIMAMAQLFGKESFSLNDLFVEERQRIMKLLSQETVTRLDRLYAEVYRDNYGIMMAFRRDELPIPQELQVAAEVALGHQLLTAVRSLEAQSSNGELHEGLLTEVEVVVAEAGTQGCKFRSGEVKEILERLLVRSVEYILHHSEPGAIEAEINNVERAIDLGERLDIGLSVTRAQEVYLQALESQIVPLCLGGIQRLNNNVSLSDDAAKNSCLLPEKQWQLPQIRKLLFLGKKLAIEVDGWLSQL